MVTNGLTSLCEERYCSYEVCKLLHEKGFDELCGYLRCFDELVLVENEYDNRIRIKNSEITNKEYITAPTHQMACDWLMEKDIYISPKYSCFRSSKGAPHYEWKPVILRLSTFNIIYPQLLDVCEYYKTYGEAVDAAIKYSLENLV